MAAAKTVASFSEVAFLAIEFLVSISDVNNDINDNNVS